MRFLQAFAALAIGFAASVAAIPTPQDAATQTIGGNVITAPAGGLRFNDGQPIELQWGTSGKPTQVRVVLAKGQPGAMTPGATIGDNLANTGYFSFTPDKSLQDSVSSGEKYSFVIQEVDSPTTVNYSPEFEIAVVDSTFVATAPAASPDAPVSSAAPSSVVPASSATPVSSSVPASASPSAVSSAPATTENSTATTSAAKSTSIAASKTSAAATSTPTSTKAPDSDDKDSKEKDNGPNIGAIIGGVFGGVAVIGLIAVALIIFFRRRKDWQRERALKNLDREHALNRVSEIQEAYRREQDAKMGPITRSDTLRTTNSNVSHNGAGIHHLSVTGGSYPSISKGSNRESEKGQFGTAF